MHSDLWNSTTQISVVTMKMWQETGVWKEWKKKKYNNIIFFFIFFRGGGDG